MMHRDPATIPRQPGVYALVCVPPGAPEKKCAYIATTVDLQKRSHMFAHMLARHDRELAAPHGPDRQTGKSKKIPWIVAGMPRYESGAYTFVTLAPNFAGPAADKALDTARRSLRAKGYKLVGTSRVSHMVTLRGRSLPLAEAIRVAQSISGGPKPVAYLTAWRRIERGWTVEQALGLAEPDARWDHVSKQLRMDRARKVRHPAVPAAPAALPRG